jgi:hypothetical protein
MTPKEKAKQLFDKMKGFRVKHSHSKKCALIAVDEILNAIEYLDEDSEYFWEEVKQEIEKL